MVSVELLEGVLFFIAAIAFTVLALKFWSLRDVVIVSVQEMGELIIFLKQYNDLESPENQLARMLKMTPEEVRTEIEKGRIMFLIGMKASGIFEALKTQVPEAGRILRSIESQIDVDKKCR